MEYTAEKSGVLKALDFEVPFEQVRTIFSKQCIEAELLAIAREWVELSVVKSAEHFLGVVCAVVVVDPTILNDNDELLDKIFLAFEQYDNDVLCPISYELMLDPVIVSSGFIMDRQSILDEVTGRLKFDQCPFTRQQLQNVVFPVKHMSSKIFDLKKSRIKKMTTIADAFASCGNTSAAEKVLLTVDELFNSFGPDSAYRSLINDVMQLRLRLIDCYDDNLEKLVLVLEDLFKFYTIVGRAKEAASILVEKALDFALKAAAKAKNREFVKGRKLLETAERIIIPVYNSSALDMEAIKTIKEKSEMIVDAMLSFSKIEENPTYANIALIKVHLFLSLIGYTKDANQIRTQISDEIFLEFYDLQIKRMDGLELWLDTTCMIDLKQPFVVGSWKSRVGERRLEGANGLEPTVEVVEGKPLVRFGYNNFGVISPQLTNLRTIISVHTFRNSPKCQFYILSGKDQGPFHGGRLSEDALLVNGHGKWVHPGAHEGSIRIDGESVGKMCETRIWTSEKLKVATVVCDSDLAQNNRFRFGNTVDRIGRDRVYHEFNGLLAELLVFNRELSTAEICDVEQYLKAKWRDIIEW